MGYFANGTEGMGYEEQWCSRCVHGSTAAGRGCAVLEAHFRYNYAQCNDKDSILHILIPRNARGENLQCRMFMTKARRSWIRKHGSEPLPFGANGAVEVK